MVFSLVLQADYDILVIVKFTKLTVMDVVEDVVERREKLFRKNFVHV